MKEEINNTVFASINMGRPYAFPTYQGKVYIPKTMFVLSEETKDFIVLEPNN